MKKHIGFVTLDFSLAGWLSNALRTAPPTPAAQELLEMLPAAPSMGQYIDVYA